MICRPPFASIEGCASGANGSIPRNGPVPSFRGRDASAVGRGISTMIVDHDGMRAPHENQNGGIGMQMGMVGLGRMGANMVRRLMAAGHQCVVRDVSPDAVAELVREGAVGS